MSAHSTGAQRKGEGMEEAMAKKMTTKLIEC